MSDWIDLVNGGGAAVVGVAGIVGTFFGGRSASREARQHARLEGSYEALTDLMMQLRYRLRKLDQGRPLPLTPEQDDELTSGIRVHLARLQLYAGETVVQALQPMLPLVDDALRLIRKPEVPSENTDELATRFEGAMDRLVDAMRGELALPKRRLTT